MTDLVKKMAPEILAEIKKANKILLHCHPKADTDSAGSALATMFALQNLGKAVTVIRGDTQLSRSLTFLPGADQIVPKTFNEVNLPDYDLFLILDSASPDRVSMIPIPTFPLAIKTIVIDHHASNPKFGDLNLVDTAYSATAQILFDLFKEWQVEITKDMAGCLFAGMRDDTSGFLRANKNTLLAVAELMDINPAIPDLVYILEHQHTPADLAFRALGLGLIEWRAGGRLGIAALPYEEIIAHSPNPDDLEGSNLVQTILSVAGCQVAITASEKKQGYTSVSFRVANGFPYDVAKVAGVLGGGGHIRAAGVLVPAPAALAKQKVLAALTQLYPDLAN